jgi:type III secretion protein T
VNGLDPLGDATLAVGVALPRIGAAFLTLPLLGAEVVPPLVRNVFAISLALALTPFLAATSDLTNLTAIGWASVLVKELVIGAMLGYLFGSIIWALEGAGEIIDAKIGATTAQIVDPVLGHQTSLTASFFSRLATYLFVAFGGLSLFIEVLLASYRVWPIDAPWPSFVWNTEALFARRFADYIVMMLMFAAPVLLVLSLVELAFGLINRYAEHLNILTTSMAVKAWMSTFVLLLALTYVAQYFLQSLADQQGILELLQQELAASSRAEPGHAGR